MEINVLSWQIYKFLFFAATDWQILSFFSLTEWRISWFLSCDWLTNFVFFPPTYWRILLGFPAIDRWFSLFFDRDWLKNFVIVFPRLINKIRDIFLLPISEFCRFYSWDRWDSFQSPPLFLCALLTKLSGFFMRSCTNFKIFLTRSIGDFRMFDRLTKFKIFFPASGWNNLSFFSATDWHFTIFCCDW